MTPINNPKEIYLETLDSERSVDLAFVRLPEFDCGLDLARLDLVFCVFLLISNLQNACVFTAK